MTREEALEILGLDPDASLDEAKKAYRALAKIYHPDKSSASNAAVMFRIISDAWEVIQNTDEQDYTETEVRSRYTKAEEERKRAEETRQRAEAKAAQAEEIRRHKEKKTEKAIKRFCYLGCLILTLIIILQGIYNQNVVHLIDIFYSIFTVCLGTIVYGRLTGWLIIKCRKKWFFKKGKEDNIEIKILFRSCLVCSIISIVVLGWEYGGSFFSDVIFPLQLNEFLNSIYSTNAMFLIIIFSSLLYAALFGWITGSIIIKTRSIIIKTSEWFKKKRIEN